MYFSTLLLHWSNLLFFAFFSPAYDKLVMFGIRIHGCIDGASHYVLYARVASNKHQETLFEPFSKAVQKFGPPLRVRSDYGARVEVAMGESKLVSE